MLDVEAAAAQAACQRHAGRESVGRVSFLVSQPLADSLRRTTAFRTSLYSRLCNGFILGDESCGCPEGSGGYVTAVLSSGPI